MDRLDKETVETAIAPDLVNYTNETRLRSHLQVCAARTLILMVLYDGTVMSVHGSADRDNRISSVQHRKPKRLSLDT